MKKLFIALFVILLAMPMVMALDIPSEIRINEGGCQILSPDFTVLKQNTNFTFYFHIYNNTSYMNNDTTNCTFHLYSSLENGRHIYINPDVGFLSPRDFEVNVTGTNFTNIGRYSYLFECGIPVEHVKTGQTNVCGIEQEFEVTKTGYDSSIQNFIPLILTIIGLILILLTLAFILHQEHGILALGFAGIGFYMLVPLLNIANMALENSYIDSGISGMVQSITTILTWADYALIIYIIVYIFIKVISGYNQDKQERIQGLKE